METIDHDPWNTMITEPDDERCNNCHSRLEDEDLYCRECGTKRGEGVFEPYRNVMQCVYGPCPTERTHTCKKCGFSWATILMIDKQGYCPKCGARIGKRHLKIGKLHIW